MGQRGSAVVEFALTIPIVLLLLLGVVEVALIARAEIQIVHAAREGARQAATSPDTAEAASAVRSALGTLAARARIRVSRPSQVGVPATVRVTMPYRVAGAVFGGFSVELSASSSMRTER